MTFDQVFSESLRLLESNRKELTLLQNSGKDLHAKPGPKSWSAIECIEHLNCTYNHYIPAFQKAISSPSLNESGTLKHGMMGKKMIDMMIVGPDKKMKKINTFKSMRPDVTNKADSPIFDLLHQHLNDLEIIIKQAQSEHFDLNKNKVTSAIGPILRFKLGDCFLFMTYHDERHLQQAFRACSN